MEIGLCYDAKGSSEEGLHYINKALNLNPNDLEYIYIQTKIYSKIGLIDEAILGYKRLLDLNCDSPNLWMELAFLKKEIDESKEAIHILESAIKIHKNNVDLLFRLGAYLFLDNQIEKASIYLQKANALDSTSSTKLFEHLPILEENAIFNQLLK